MALQRQVFSIPIAEGVNTKVDDKQLSPGKALSLENVRFEKAGKIQKRFGLVPLTTNSNNNSFATSTIKCVVSDDNYISAKTSTGIYGYSKTLNQWVNQVNYQGSFSIKTNFICRNYLNQSAADQDTSEDGLLTIYGSLQGNIVNLVLKDNQTGLIKKTSLIIFNQASILRVFCELFSGTYRIIVLVNNFVPVTGPFQTKIYRLDSNLSVVSDGVLSGFGSFASFNATRDSSNIYVANMTSTTLTTRKLDFNGSVVASGSATSLLSSNTRLAMSAFNGILHVLYGATISANEYYYLVALNTTLGVIDKEQYLYIANGYTTPSLHYDGTTVTFGGEFTDFLGVTNTEGVSYTAVPFSTSTGYGTAFSPIISYRRIRLASEPFKVGSELFVICYTFRNEITNPKSFYILNITTKFITQIFSPATASVHGSIVSKARVIGTKVFTSILKEINPPNDSGETFATIASAAVNLEYGENYFDNSRVKVDKRIYLCDGGLTEMDTSRPHENGFIFTPEFYSVSSFTGTTNPNVASKTFSYALTYEYYDSDGLKTVSAPVFRTNFVTSATTEYVKIVGFEPVGSMKFHSTSYPASSSMVRPRAVIYRTTNSGSVYYRIGEATIDNEGSAFTYEDTAADGTITNNETLYTTGGVLENNPAPPADFCFSGGNRIFLGGLEEKDEIAYSKKQLFGESVYFSDFFRIRVSTGLSFDRSPITAGGYMDGKIIIFRQQSIYFCQGDGPNELGIGDFSNPEIISTDVGCIDPRSVVNMPLGLMFKSKKGIYLLSRSLSVSYVGSDVEAFNQYNIHSAVLAENYNEVRFYMSNGQCLVYNYFFEAWSIFTDQGVIDSDIWESNPVVVKSGKIQVETPNIFKDDNAFYSMKFVSPWLKMDLIQGYARFYQLWIIGNFKSAHTLKCDVTTDYLSFPVEQYSLVYNNTDSAQYQYQISLPKQKVESIKFEIYDINHEVGSTGESYDLSNIQLEVGMKAGGYKLAATKSY